MKILFLANQLPHRDVAGGHKLIYQRMRQLSDLGHEVGLAAFAHPGEERVLPKLQAEFREVKTVQTRERRIMVRMFRDYLSSSLPAIFWKNHAREMMKCVGDMVERGAYDVVIAEYSEMGMYLYRNPYLSAVHKVVSCHRCLTTAFSKYVETPGVHLSLRLKSASQVRRLERYEFEMYRAMDHILTLTPEDSFTLLHHSPQLPITVIPPGIDFDFLNSKPMEKPEEPVVMMCGYFADKSNHDGAIWFIDEVWPLISRIHPALRCTFVGKGVTPAMTKRAERDESLRMIAEIDDLRPYRQQAFVFINPMRLGSGLRIKVLEAMATGLPVVSTALGVAGIPAQNGENCFVADTPELFAQSIDWLLNDRMLAVRMGRKAGEMVKHHFDIRTTILQLEKVLNEVVSIRQ